MYSARSAAHSFHPGMPYDRPHGQDPSIPFLNLEDKNFNKTQNPKSQHKRFETMTNIDQMLINEADIDLKQKSPTKKLTARK